MSGSSYNRLRTRATILVKLDLPPNVSIANDPTARSVVLERAVPSFFDSSALDHLFMYDGRENDLATQALHATQSHFQPGVLPTASQLQAIAAFERTQFTSDAIEDYAEGGAAPKLPEGRTPLERAGQVFFADHGDPSNAKVGFCSSCHGGPMLDTMQSWNIFGAPAGVRFAPILSWQLSRKPQDHWLFRVAGGPPQVVPSADPGRALITGNPADVDLFRMRTLWGVSRKGNFMHDNRFLSLEEVMDHYQRFSGAASAHFHRNVLLPTPTRPPSSRTRSSSDGPMLTG